MTKRTSLLIIAVVLLAVLAFGLQRNGNVNRRESPFSEQRAGQDLQTIVGFGQRPAGSEALAKTRN